MEEITPHLSAKALYDYELVQKALKNSDQKAYAELMDRHKEPLFYMMYKMVNNKDDAEDLTIEAFGKAFSKLEQYSSKYAFSTWLYRIATNNCIDFFRNRKLQNTYSLNNDIEGKDGVKIVRDFSNDELAADETIHRKEKYKKLHVIINNLKPKYRQLVHYYYIEELSYDEIAEKLNLPLGTVKGSLNRARGFLQEMLKKIAD